MRWDAEEGRKSHTVSDLPFTHSFLGDGVPLMLQLLIKACFLVCLLVYYEKNPTQWTNVKSRADAEKMAKIRSANNTENTQHLY